MPAQGAATSRSPLNLTLAEQSAGCATACVQIPDQASACIDVNLLGGLRVRAGRTTMGPRELGGTKLRRVLLALVLHRGSPVSKDLLVSMLWEGSPPSGAKATLESYVCVLRKTLQPCREVRTSLITTTAGCYAIDMSRVDLDLVRYEHLLSDALEPAASATEALPMLRQAMSLVESPLLPEELDCDWLDDARRIHHQNVRKDLIAAADKVASLPSPDAGRWARMALEVDPLDESAWHALLRSMEANEHHADGLRAYEQCRGLFAAELGCTPGPRLQELYLRLLRGANEDNAELTQLFEAVARLHAQSQLRPQTPLRAPARERREANGHAQSIDRACQALDLLLESFGRGRQEIIAEADRRASA
jgi:SARP family transcriptional regulator, regulator of embCAB operon